MSSYYTDTLYPLQDKVLRTIGSLKTPFYLTGGTALSRCYLNHRYSDDLDFFVNNEPLFLTRVTSIIASLQKEFAIEVLMKSESYVSLRVNTILKVDFVNDVSFRFGELTNTLIYSQVDNLENILSNKLSALISRDEPKDVVDIWMIVKKIRPDWKKIFSDVGSKAVGIFPLDVAQRLTHFPLEMINFIKWQEGMKPEEATLKREIGALCDSMLHIQKKM